MHYERMQFSDPILRGLCHEVTPLFLQRRGLPTPKT